MEWISVEDRTPTIDYSTVLIVEGGSVDVGYYGPDGGWYLVRTDSYDEPIRAFVTHWMPLPDPPKEAE